MPKTNFAWVLVAVWIGCTSTNDPVVAVTDAGADAKKDSGPVKDGGATGDDGGTTKTDGSSVEEDAAPGVCAPISGGLACDPGKIYCGSSNCDAATEECCVDLAGASAATSCVAKGGCTGTNKVGMACDEKDDCATGEICCFTSDGAKPTGAVCQAGPCLVAGSPTDFAQSCRGDFECENTGSCVSGNCKGYSVQTCSTFPSAACGL